MVTVVAEKVTLWVAGVIPHWHTDSRAWGDAIVVGSVRGGGDPPSYVCAMR